MNKSRGLLVNPENNDLLIIDGKMQIGDVTAQNQYHILQTHMGECKHAPTIGVGLSDFVLDDNLGLWQREIRIQLEQDGMTVRSVELDNNFNLKINASYN